MRPIAIFHFLTTRVMINLNPIAIFHFLTHKKVYLSLLFFILFLIALFQAPVSQIGTAGQYSSPFLPTACDGYDHPIQLPSNNLFAAAGDEIWDHGAACGRQYLVKCLNGAEPETCVAGEVIQVTIVDYATSNEGATMVLSATAFRLIADPTAESIDIKFIRAWFINKKVLWGIIQKANWSYELKFKAQFGSWTPEIKDVMAELEAHMLSVRFNVEAGFAIVTIEGKFPHMKELLLCSYTILHFYSIPLFLKQHFVSFSLTHSKT